jgi:hypothetical protein
MTDRFNISIVQREKTRPELTGIDRINRIEFKVSV